MSKANHLKILEIGAFKDCSKIGSLSLQSTTETIDQEAFMNCNGITSQ